MAYRVTTYRAPAYTRTYTKSYSTSTSTKTFSQPTKTYTTIARPKTVINTTTVVHQPVYHDSGWHMPWYHAPIVVAPVYSTPVVAQPMAVDPTQTMSVPQAIPQPMYYDNSAGVIAVVLFGLLIVAVCTMLIRRGYSKV